MNRVYQSLFFCALLSVCASCKKNNDNINSKTSQSAVQEVDDDFQAKLASIDISYQPRQVVTIAGKNGERGYRDGAGNQALFQSPWGIEMTQDGNLLVSDPINNKVRKVTTDGFVTTLSVPAATDGSQLLSPYYARQSNDGTLAIKALEMKARYWIVKPNGQTTVSTGPRNGYYGSLAKDPYNNYFWTSGLNIGNSNVFSGFIEKFLPSGALGINAQSFPSSAFSDADDARNPTISTVFVGYNNIKYMVVDGNHIYKLTPSGQFKQLFTNFKFDPIDDIIANKDSRTLYLSSGGNIYGITNNKLYRLAGPNAPIDGHDGIGSGADVRAFNLALSKDENTIYFTDARITVRKLILK